MEKHLKRKLKNIGGGIIAISIVSLLFYMGYLDETKYSRRTELMKETNKTVIGEITEFESITSGSQGFEGGHAYFGGYSIDYRYYYKGISYTGAEFIPNEPEFKNIIKNCSGLGLFDKVEIRIDSLNPENSLLNFK